MVSTVGETQVSLVSNRLDFRISIPKFAVSPLHKLWSIGEIMCAIKRQQQVFPHLECLSYRLGDECCLIALEYVTHHLRRLLDAVTARKEAFIVVLSHFRTLSRLLSRFLTLSRLLCHQKTVINGRSAFSENGLLSFPPFLNVQTDE